MCIAVAGRVLETDGIAGKVEVSGNILEVRMGVAKAKPGDYVLVHAGYAVQVVEKSEAEEIRDLFKELESMWHE